MKNYFILNIIIAIAFYNAREAVGKKYEVNVFINNIQSKDTAAYLHDHFILGKERFQHKELNVLLTELNLTVKSYSLVLGAKPGAQYKCLILFFEKSNSISDKVQRNAKITFLSINFETDIPKGKAMGLYSKTYGTWSNHEKSFYGNIIVKDIGELSPGKNR